MRHPNAGKPRGILNPHKGKQKFGLQRYLPRKELSYFIEHYWIVKWNLPEEDPYITETLPHPSIHIVFEDGNSKIFGIMEGKFSRELKGKGKVFGIKFKPGGFYPFVKKPVSSFRNKLLGIENLFEIDSKALENSILSKRYDNEMIKKAEKFLIEHLPEEDDNILLVNKIVELIINHKEITKVEDIVKKINISKRSLQRLFNNYVGISPKWMIKRYRLHEAVEQLAAASRVDWVELALSLGYFDQAHFIKDFKSIVGKTPSEYEKEL